MKIAIDIDNMTDATADMIEFSQRPVQSAHHGSYRLYPECQCGRLRTGHCLLS